jgi:multiple sugar transport system substrate-binding protein
VRFLADWPLKPHPLRNLSRTSLLQRAAFTLADVPREEAFWCDKAQPTVRKALGRDVIWGIGLPMSASVDTGNAFFQFAHAYEADFVTRDGRLVIDEPLVRDRLVKVLDSYTAIWRKGCTPPDAAGWDATGNTKAFLAQTVVMTLNQTLYSSYYAAVSGNWRHTKMEQERVWENAIYRIATKGITPEQAAGEAIARVKQLLRE